MHMLFLTVFWLAVGMSIFRVSIVFMTLELKVHLLGGAEKSAQLLRHSRKAGYGAEPLLELCLGLVVPMTPHAAPETLKP